MDTIYNDHSFTTSPNILQLSATSTSSLNSILYLLHVVIVYYGPREREVWDNERVWNSTRVKGEGYNFIQVELPASQPWLIAFFIYVAFDNLKFKQYFFFPFMKIHFYTQTEWETIHFKVLNKLYRYSNIKTKRVPISSRTFVEVFLWNQAFPLNKA